MRWMPRPCRTASTCAGNTRDPASAVLDERGAELIGLSPVKQRIREPAALLMLDRARARLGPSHEPPALHVSFTGNPGTGKTTAAQKMAGLLHRLGHVRNAHVVSVTRNDLVGPYIGHTATKAKQVLKKGDGGVCFSAMRPITSTSPTTNGITGQEAIEILLQVMENNSDDLVVIMAGHANRMDRFFSANPGFRSRIAHHIDFPDYSDDELGRIADTMLAGQGYRLDDAAPATMNEYVGLRRAQPDFANARSIRNARGPRAPANRLFRQGGPASAADLSTITEPDLRARRVFSGGLDPDGSRKRDEA